MTEVRVELNSVQCRETNDFGEDEFYIIGLTGRSNGQDKKVIVIPPIGISDNDPNAIVGIADPRRVVFGSRMTSTDEAIIALTAWDEDFGGAREGVDSLLAGAALDPPPAAEPGGTLAEFFTDLSKVGELLDPDTRLGVLSLTIPMEGPALQEGVWEIRDAGSNYDVKYRITRTMVPSP